MNLMIIITVMIWNFNSGLVQISTASALQNGRVYLFLLLGWGVARLSHLLEVELLSLRKLSYEITLTSGTWQFGKT